MRTPSDAAFVVDDEYTSRVISRLREIAAQTRGHARSADHRASLPPAEVTAEALFDVLNGLGSPPSESKLPSLLGPFWSGARVRELLGGISRQALLSRRKHHSLLGLPLADESLVYPLFQFERITSADPGGAQIQVRPALKMVLSILKDLDAWEVATLLRAKAPELDDTAPLDWIRDEPEHTDRLSWWASVVAEERAR